MIELSNIRKAGLLQEKFAGRADCYGAGRGACIKKPLTIGVILRHILGRERIGIYLLRMDGRIIALAVDFDDNNLFTVIEYCAVCESYGIAADIERSKSKGYHAWLFFDDLVPAWKARAVASCILDDCGLLGKVEIFPKQDSLVPGRYGNYINLPEFGQDVERGRTVFLNPGADYTPYEDQWSFLSAATKISEAKLDEIVEVNSLGKPAPVVEREAEAVAGYQGERLPCFSRALREGVEQGMRNEAALRISVNLRRNGLPPDLAMVMMLEWNKRNGPPMEVTELEKTVSNAYSNKYGLGCRSPLMQRYCDPSCPIFKKYDGKGALDGGSRCSS